MIDTILQNAGIKPTQKRINQINAQYQKYKAQGFNVPVEKIAEYVAENYLTGEVTLMQIFHNLQFMKMSPIVKKPKIGRNEPCICGSGRKFKKCCSNKYQ